MTDTSKLVENTLATWPIRNDQIVLMSVAGMDQATVAKHFGLTNQQISRILKDPRAQSVVERARERLQERIFEGVEAELDLAARAAVKAIKVTLNADISAFHKAKPNQDRVAIKILEGRGHLKSSTDEGGDGGFRVTDEQFKKLMTAMEKSDAAEKIDPFAGREIVVEAQVVEK